MSRITYTAPDAIAQGGLTTRTLGTGHVTSKEALIPNSSGSGFNNTETNESTV
jgi:hypothetical protein